MTLGLFLENETSCAIFVGSGLNDIFRCCPHLFIFSRSLLRLAVVSSYSDVSPTKSLAEQRSPEGRSFMWLRKNNGPNIDYWGIPAVNLFQLEVFPFNTTLWYLSDKTLSVSLNKSPFMPLCYLSCHTLSNASEIPINKPITSKEGLQSKALYISWDIETH